MTLKEARWILLEHRPDRPQMTSKRQLQCAIDVVVGVLDKVIKEEDGSDKQADY